MNLYSYIITSEMWQLTVNPEFVLRHTSQTNVLVMAIGQPNVKETMLFWADITRPR